MQYSNCYNSSINDLYRRRVGGDGGRAAGAGGRRRAGLRAAGAAGAAGGARQVRPDATHRARHQAGITDQ